MTSPVYVIYSDGEIARDEYGLAHINDTESGANEMIALWRQLGNAHVLTVVEHDEEPAQVWRAPENPSYRNI